MGMGGPMGFSMGDDPARDEVKPPKNINTNPPFVAGKEAQYAACMEMINQNIGDAFNERAYGAIIGAFAGDSCGSYCEFDENFPSDKKIEECMKMPGGGYH